MAGAQLASIYSRFLENKFRVDDIGLLHRSVCMPVLKHGTDQRTPIHKEVYAEYDRDRSELKDSYRDLQREWVGELRKRYSIEEWAVQRFPSLRVHFPNNVSVFEFHRDSDYEHPLGEINHFLSINRSHCSAALHIEEELGWSNYVPLELDPGQSAIINTSIFKHGDFENHEGYTRVSIDFRAIPVEALERHGSRRSITKGKSFDCDDYFISSCAL